MKDKIIEWFQAQKQGISRSSTTGVYYIDGSYDLAELAKFLESIPIIDNACTPAECAHEDYCRKVTVRVQGWHHCNAECPQLKLESR